MKKSTEHHIDSPDQAVYFLSLIQNHFRHLSEVSIPSFTDTSDQVAQTSQFEQRSSFLSRLLLVDKQLTEIENWLLHLEVSRRNAQQIYRIHKVLEKSSDTLHKIIAKLEAYRTLPNYYQQYKESTSLLAKIERMLLRASKSKEYKYEYFKHVEQQLQVKLRKSLPHVKWTLRKRKLI